MNHREWRFVSLGGSLALPDRDDRGRARSCQAGRDQTWSRPFPSPSGTERLRHATGIRSKRRCQRKWREPDRATITTRLLETVRDRTGYPIETLGLELDMEADLGIDSIKRVEILGKLRDVFPGLKGLSESAETMDALTQARTWARSSSEWSRRGFGPRSCQSYRAVVSKGWEGGRRLFSEHRSSRPTS